MKILKVIEMTSRQHIPKLKDLRSIFTKRFLVAILLTLISTLLILPTPWQKENLFFWGYHEEGVMISEIVRFENRLLEIFVNSTNFPSLIKYYDVHFVNQYTENENQDLLLRIQLRQESDFWNYANNFRNHSLVSIEFVKVNL